MTEGVRIRGQILTLYTFSHFAVDFICAFLILGEFTGSRTGWLGILIYNFCAFALQMPFGAAADQMKNCVRLSAAGTCLLAVMASLFSFHGSWAIDPAGLAGGALPLIYAGVIGVGNALFHIGCGTEVIRRSEGHCGECGIFVSSGALGLYLGKRFLSAGGWVRMIPALILWILALLLWKQGPETAGAAGASEKTGSAHPFGRVPAQGRELSGREGPYVLCFAALFAVVVLRSAIGMRVSFPWSKNWPLLLVICVVLGKMLGGICSDCFGEERTIRASLLLSVVLFLVSIAPPAGMAALLLFNMTMPVTLTALSRLTGRPGFAFGTLTLALFIGSLPKAAGRMAADFRPGLYAALAGISLILMLAAWHWEGEA